MKRFRKSQYRDIEAELERHRPQPRADFLSALVGSLDERARRRSPRFALAGALTVAMLAAFAMLGGLGYAATLAKQATQVTKVARIVGIAPASHTVRPPARGAVRGHGFTFGAAATASGLNKAEKGKGKDDDDDPGDDEYKPGKGCGDKNHIHRRKNECKKPHK